MEGVETLLLDAFERFRSAVARHQLLHETVHSDHAEVLAAADDILRARLALYRSLQSDGWTPPDHIRLQLDADRRLLTEQDDRQLPDSR